MKKIYLIGWIWGLLGLAACSDWLDVSPKTNVKAEDLFTTEDGFKSALTGIYGRMTKDVLYGRNLTFLFMEELAQRYDNHTGATDEQRAEIYDYINNSDSKGKLANIWSEMYKDIANINNLLKNLRENGHCISSPGYREWIEGEALGLRAFHYLDLLRMWGPVDYENNQTVKVLPWRSEFTPDKVRLMQADSIAIHILEDLKAAEVLLQDDPLNYGHIPEEPFVAYRQQRMNKYAVKALMARVYLWINDKTNAAIKAREVINDCKLKLVRDNQQDITMLDETLFGLNMYNMHERLNNYFPEVPGGTNVNDLWVSQDNIRTVYEGTSVGINDIRYKRGYGFKYYEQKALSRKYTDVESVAYNEKIPLIRLSEMYYILAESLSLGEGDDFLNAVRNARGISKKNDLVFTDDDQRQVEIQKEYQKDFWGEGQFFFYLKRHGVKNFYRCPLPEGMTVADYVFPIPADEIEFGLVE